MITSVSPALRRRLVVARVAAMTLGLDDGRRELREAQSTVVSNIDRVAVALTECDVLASDLQPAVALEVFEREIDPLLTELDPRMATLIADNKTSLSLDSSGRVGDFYHLVDARRILGMRTLDHASKLAAVSQAAAGRHYEALSTYWQQLRRSYELQNWRARSVAATDFSEECVQLGWLDEAAYHAMISGTKKAAERVGAVLLGCRSADRIAAAISKLLTTSALRGHAQQTVRILAGCSDALPHILLDRVAAFLLTHSRFTPSGWHDLGLFESVWNTISRLAHRVTEHTVRKLLAEALESPALETGGPARKHLVDGINALTGAAPPEELPKIAETALILANERRSDFDYKESLNLLCHAADRGGKDVKQVALRRLFPPGVSIRDSRLMQVGPFLGWQPKDPDSFTSAALQTADAVRKQVQRLATGQEPARIGGYGTISGTQGSGRIVVHMQGAMHNVQAVAAHLASVSDEAVHELVSAMLDMVAESENTISNRAALVAAIEEFLCRVRPELCNRVARVLEPLASGEIAEPSQGQTHAEAKSPLNPFKMATGDPVDLQGAALKLLCVLDREHAGISPSLHETILLGALTNANAEVRRYSMYAARHGANMTSSEKAVIAMAGLDPDPRVARLAIHAIIDSGGLANLDPLIWQIVVRTIESAVNSGDGGLRASAARMLTVLKNWPEEVATRIQDARVALESDALFSVRHLLKS